VTQELSPATQAAYDAFNRVGLYNEPAFETDRKALAAAFRSAAENFLMDWDAIRCCEFLLDMADELEAE